MKSLNKTMGRKKTMSKPYGIFNKRNLVVEDGENTTNSRYALGVSTGVPLRTASTRAEARLIKQQFKNPQQYAIVNIPEFAVVR